MEAVRTISIAQVRRLAEQAGMRLREQVSFSGHRHYSVRRGNKKDVFHTHNLADMAEWLSIWVKHVK